MAATGRFSIYIVPFVFSLPLKPTISACSATSVQLRDSCASTFWSCCAPSLPLKKSPKVTFPYLSVNFWILNFWNHLKRWNFETIFFDDLKPLRRSGLFLTGCEARDHLRSCWWFFGHPWHVPRPSATSGCFGCWWATGYDWLRLSKHARIWTATWRSLRN